MDHPVAQRIWRNRKTIASVGFDLLCIWLILSIRWEGQTRLDPGLGETAHLPSWWWDWGNLQDWLLIGPDAGNWARNAEAWASGGVLDPHRLPTYTMLNAWFYGFFGDVVVGGHMLNHLLSALLGVVAYGIGRSTSGRAVGLGAGLLTAWSPELFNEQLKYGVDPALQLSVVFLALCTWLAMRKGTWPWIVLMGLSLGLAMGTHYLVLLFVPIALGLLLFMEKPWTIRLRYTTACLLIAWLMFEWLTHRYDDLSLQMVASVYSQGVAGSDWGAGAATPMGAEHASSQVLHNLPSAPGLAVQRGLRAMKVSGMNWTVLVVIFWVGVIGWGLGKKRETSRWDWRGSLFFLGFLGPLVLLEATRAPDRYALFARPLIFICVLRGVVSLFYIAEEMTARHTSWIAVKWRPTTRGVLSALAIIFCLQIYQQPFTDRWWNPSELPSGEGLSDRTVSDIIKKNFPRPGGIVTSSQALSYYTQRNRCPGSQCPDGGKIAVAQCFERYLQECPGAGSLPYIAVSEKRKEGFGDRTNSAVQLVVEQQFEALGGHSYRDGGSSITTTVYSLGRVQLRQLATALRSTP